MKKLIDAARTRLRLLIAGREAESRMSREFQFHIDMEAEQLVRTKGLPPAEARRRALAAFGGVEKHKEALRDGRGLAWVRGWSVNVKLGTRMLAKYPGVTIVGVAAMAIGIGLAAAYLEAVNDLLHPTLPLEDGRRIVGLQNWDVSQNRPELRSTRDFVAWRQELRSVQNLGAYREVQPNVGPANGPAEPAPGVEITASGFEVARVPALLGRTLIPADERDGASPVIVLGHQLWRNRFQGDPAIVSRPIQVGRDLMTVVGVMPEGFAFPVSHSFWMPFRAGTLRHESSQGPAVRMFGRLAPGISLEEAQAELSAVGLRASRERPATHEHLRPQVMKYTDLFVGDEDNWQAYLGQGIFVLLLLVLGSNVATMVFARTATRENEIAMRFALGASRGQILAQFFAEALVLALIAAVLGLTFVAWVANWATGFFWDVTQHQMPFWLDDSLNTGTVVYALVLAVIVSLVAGVMPAVKATSSRARARLRHAGGSGDSGLRFGGLWNALVVVQVVFAVLVVPPALVAISGLGEPDHVDPGFAAAEYLGAHVAMEADASEFHRTRDELRHRLMARPEVSQVTFASRLPGMAHPEQWVDVDPDGTSSGATGELATASAVDVNFFETFGARLVGGRSFNAGDLQNSRKVVIVNEYFVDEILHGRNAVGRRIRYSNRYNERAATGQPQGLPRAAMLQRGDWYEIVGVVSNIGMDTTKDAFTSGKGPGVYHPLTEGAMGTAGAYGVRIALHVRGDVHGFAPTVRQVAHAVSPGLRLLEVVTLDGPVDRVSRTQRRIGRVASWTTAVVALIALLISVAGTYSVLAFTVARQTREIGIRIALGADRRRILSGVFSRAMAQIGTGIAIGVVLWFYVIVYQLGGGNRLGLLLVAAVVVVALGLVACGVPVRRALRIEPTEALRTLG